MSPFTSVSYAHPLPSSRPPLFVAATAPEVIGAASVTSTTAGAPPTAAPPHAASGRANSSSGGAQRFISRASYRNPRSTLRAPHHRPTLSPHNSPFRHGGDRLRRRYRPSCCVPWVSWDH